MNIEELKRLAEAANKGFSGLPWQVIMERNNHGSTHYRVRGHCEASIAVEPDQYWEEDYDPPTDEYGYFQPDDRMDCDLVRVDIARHIAAANPAAMLELIRQRDELLAALKEAQEQEPVAWLCGADVAQNKDYAEWFTAFTKESAIPLYARPVPAVPAVAVPEMTDDALKEILNAAQIVGYDDPLRIVRGFAMRVLQKWGNQEGMHKAFLDAVKPAAVLELIQQRDELLASLKEARELVEDWGAYAPAYMQEKHDLEGDMNKLDAAIARAEAP